MNIHTCSCNIVHKDICQALHVMSANSYYFACAGFKRVDLPRVVWSDGCAARPARSGGAGSKPGAAKYFSHPHAQWPCLSRKITAVCGVSLQIRRGY